MKDEELVVLFMLFLFMSDALHGVSIAFNINNIIALIIAIPMYLFEMIYSSAISRNLPMFAISTISAYYLWNFVSSKFKGNNLSQLFIIILFISYFLR